MKGKARTPHSAETTVQDRTRWYITVPRKENGYRPVENEAGEPVELNTPQTAEDKAVWNSLRMEQRYRELWPMLYECIVFGHNYRNGYIRGPVPANTTEAICMVRTEFNRGLDRIYRR